MSRLGPPDTGKTSVSCGDISGGSSNCQEAGALPCKERLREGLAQPGEDTALGAPNSSPSSTNKEVINKTESRSAQQCMVGG